MELSLPLVDILKLNHCHAATSVPPSARARAGKINPPKLEGKAKKCQGVRISCSALLPDAAVPDMQ